MAKASARAESGGWVTDGARKMDQEALSLGARMDEMIDEIGARLGEIPSDKRAIMHAHSVRAPDGRLFLVSVRAVQEPDSNEDPTEPGEVE